MFTGLVQSKGVLRSRRLAGGSGKLTIQSACLFEDLQRGESIAVNGCCLTLESFDAHGELLFHTLEESLRKTNLGALTLGSTVNLERALRPVDRLGGHLVSGHVDAVGTVRSWHKAGADTVLSINYPPELASCLAEKGSVAIDGVSLTVVGLTDETFSVHLIPTTLGDTALVERKSGELVNLETDLVAKYIERQLAFLRPETRTENRVTLQRLFEAGWGGRS